MFNFGKIFEGGVEQGVESKEQKAEKVITKMFSESPEEIRQRMINNQDKNI